MRLLPLSLSPFRLASPVHMHVVYRKESSNWALSRECLVSRPLYTLRHNVSSLQYPERYKDADGLRDNDKDDIHYTLQVQVTLH